MASADNNNMSIELYKPSKVGETDAANPTINADSNPANAADSSTTISDNHNTDSTTGWEWRWPEIRFTEFKKTSILMDVRTELIKEFENKLKLGSRNLELFRESCFGGSFDPNEDCDLPTDGVYRKFIDPLNNFSKNGAKYEFVFELFMNAPRNLKKSRESLLKIAKVLFVHGFFYAIDKRHRIVNCLWVLVEQEDEWETFAWGAYSFQILMFRMKNAVVKPQDNYHIYGFSHAFMHFIAEAVPGLADIITPKPKHKCVQPRLLKRLFLKKSSLYLDFFDKQVYFYLK
ncbi:hypothetical protein CASFOL_028432 [Castilleja foliolosa]|uniref:Aminotransferase-like plant mobile domain-containing protein n=1 Tax=Castilleja foliolosa TaxID=1961234 RepID=A0ABD3CCK7_9LAMI